LSEEDFGPHKQLSLKFIPYDEFHDPVLVKDSIKQYEFGWDTKLSEKEIGVDADEKIKILNDVLIDFISTGSEKSFEELITCCNRVKKHGKITIIVDYEISGIILDLMDECNFVSARKCIYRITRRIEKLLGMNYKPLTTEFPSADQAKTIHSNIIAEIKELYEKGFGVRMDIFYFTTCTGGLKNET